MVTWKDSTELQAAYRTKFPTDGGHAVWLAGDMAGALPEARGAVSFLNEWLKDSSGVDLAGQALREVADRRRQTDTSIMELVHGLARSDEYFDDMAEAAVRAERQLAPLQRQARKWQVSTKGIMTDALAIQKKL